MYNLTQEMLTAAYKDAEKKGKLGIGFGGEAPGPYVKPKKTQSKTTTKKFDSKKYETAHKKAFGI